MAAVVFDFDHSFAEECADFWILEQLGRPGVESLVYMRDRLKADPLVWNKCMQEITDILFRAGVSRPAIEQAARRIPVFPHHVAVIQLAHQLRMSCHIVSDANEVWINECLAAHSIRDLFTSVNTNPASFDATGRLRISAHHPSGSPPHGCALSAINMDKCSVMRSLGLGSASKSDADRPRVFYVGDGSGDLCAALSLGPNDVVCAREGYTLLKRLRSPEYAPRARAQVVPWSHGADVLRAFVAFAGGAAGDEAAAGCVAAALARGYGPGAWPSVLALLAQGSAAGPVVGGAVDAGTAAPPPVDGVGDPLVAAEARRAREEVSYGWM